ncbi:MAG TPA: amidohydrolase family protein [Myxococcota bacterium]|nr:amidohydrolase family protein [Myxococcota bacterium]
MPTTALRDMYTVDADGHVMEPADLWLRYLEPEYRDRALQIQVDADGLESLYGEGKPMRLMRGTLGALGGIEAKDAAARQAFQTPGARTYAEGCPPGGYDPRARLAVMDSEGIDAALLYPTIGICWEGSVDDPALATAYTRAYNRWIVDFCSADRRRLVPVAHITLLDPDGAVREAKRARDAGCAAVYLSPDLPARRGRMFDDPLFARFFATLEDLEMPLSFHVVARENPLFAPWSLAAGSGDGVFSFAFLAIDVMAAFTSMMTRGMFEKHPRLRCAVLEAGSNWITAWLGRLDHKYEMGGFPSPLKLLPSEYFRRQCVISAEPDEALTGPVLEYLGEDLMVWSSDYPHIDASFGVVDEIRSRLAGLPESAQRKVLGENAARFYELSTQEP